MAIRTRGFRAARASLTRAGIRAHSRCESDGGRCQRRGSRSAPHSAQPAAYGVTRSPQCGQ
jgi:hypothetical protein